MGNCCSQEVDFSGEPTLYHFDLNRAVGKGAFGKVRIVQHRPTKKQYALKYINKAQCIKQKAVANIIQERRFLEEVDHPFICNMRYAFQDDENCFMVLDLMLGGDLRFHLDRHGPMSEPTVRLWIAELSSALEYLHRQRIIHRDIKPDNILLDSAGHAHLTDFNVAMHYSARRLHSSIGGSLAYMAPEMLAKRPSASSPGTTKPAGYTWCVDWWSLGVTGFEVLFGRRPFDGKTADAMKKQISSESIRFAGVSGSKIEPSTACLDVLHGFLERDPFRRLGCRPHGGGLSDIQNHPWFSDISWSDLESKSIQPTYVPSDTAANFDVTHELDEFLMLEKPLSHKHRKTGVDVEKMSPERRELETGFTVYDYAATMRMSYFPPEDPEDGPSSSNAASRAASPDTNTLAPRPSNTSTRKPSRSPARTATTVGDRDRPNSSETHVDGSRHSPSPSLLPTATILENRSAVATPIPQPMSPHLQDTPPPLPTARPPTRTARR